MVTVSGTVLPKERPSLVVRLARFAQFARRFAAHMGQAHGDHGIMEMEFSPLLRRDRLHFIDLIRLHVEEDRIRFAVLIVDLPALQYADFTEVERVD